MRTLLSRAIQIDPSFHIALGVIVILAIAEVFFATSYYVGQVRANRVSAQMAAIVNNTGVHNSLSFHSPVASLAPQTTPPPAEVSNTPAPSIVDQLLREGKELRKRGDTTNALARFQEALDSEPDNSGALQEMAQ